MPRWPQVKIAGVNVNVVPDSVAESCDLAICADWDGPRYFPDDVRAVCAGCGKALRHRPYMPKKPMKMCMECGLGWVTRH
jgi:hypothetical protein